jgi:TPR repeat protein
MIGKVGVDMRIIRIILMFVGLAVAANFVAPGFAQEEALQALSFIKRLKLARAGDELAQLSVAVDYENGSNDARKDQLEAAKWYRQAALAGNMEAQFRLSKLIVRGPQGLAVDPADGLKLLRSAADKGYAPAQNELGLRLQKGTGVAVNLPEAFQWFQKASDQGNTSAQVNLGLLLVKGEGASQDLPKAFSLFQKAADAGDHWGQNNLGSMYEMGWGVGKNLDRAKEFYKIAADNGNPMAPINLNRLNTN